MAIPNATGVIITRVNAIKTPDLTPAEEETILTDYTEIAVAASVADYGNIVGSSRQVEYTASSMSSAQRTATGVDKLGAEIWSRAKLSGSTWIHDGTEKFIIVDAVVYHYPSSDDFEDVADLINYRMPL